MFKELDPLLHSPLRLAIVSFLVAVDACDFTTLKTETKASAGNLSVQLSKLEDASYVKIEKSFKNKRPLTTCTLTKTGKKAFESYVSAMQDYLNPNKLE